MLLSESSEIQIKLDLWHVFWRYHYIDPFMRVYKLPIKSLKN